MNKPDKFDELARHLRADHDGWNTDAAWSRMQGRMQKQRPDRRPWLIAALLVVALGVGVLGRNYLTRATELPAQAQVERFSTGVGERRTVQLADGSTVELAPLSQLNVREFDRSGRGVELKGRAFFTVARDPRRPFLVRAHNAEVEVLGTSFDIDAYPGDVARIAVASGRVRVASKVVTPGQMATVSADGSVAVATADVEALIAWRRGELAFNNARFADVSAAIERWYDVDIEVPDAQLADARVTAAFAGQSIDEVLELLAATLDARFARAGNRITYYAE